MSLFNKHTFLLLFLTFMANGSFIFAQEGKLNAAVAKKPTIILASKYGVSSQNSNNAAALQKALMACRNKQNPVIVLPGGRIDLWQQGAVTKELYVSNSTEDDTLPKTKYIALSLEKFNNLTIEGNNTLIVLHGKMVSFAIINSQNIILKNLAFDYERPTMSELTITKVSPGAVEASVHPDSKYLIENERIVFYGEGWKANAFHTIVFDPATNTMKYSSFNAFIKSRAIQLQPDRVRFEGDFSKSKIKEGEVLTVRDPYRDQSGGFISVSKNILLQNVQVHYMHGMGIVSQLSENLTYRNVSVTPRKQSGRIISAFADCFHFSGCKGKIVIDSCFTSGTHDDPVNVHGTHLKITAQVSSKKIKVRFMHHQTYGFNAFFAGDSIAFTDQQTLQTLGYAKISKARLISKREMELETDKPLPKMVKEGIVIENISWTPEVTIRNSRFERTNTRGILITTRRKVLIENNHFYKTGMHGILIANDAASWYESGPVQDVTIRKNIFEGVGYNQTPDGYVIAIAPENHRSLPGLFVHRNVHIHNNVFRLGSPALITAKSTAGLIISGNIIEKTADAAFDSSPVLRLDGCNNVQVMGNVFKKIAPAEIKTNNMQDAVLQTDLKQIGK